MHLALVLLLFFVQKCNTFTLNNQNDTLSSRIDFDGEKPVAAALKSRNDDSIAVFGKQVELPSWISNVGDKSQDLFHSAASLVGVKNSRTSAENFLTQLRKDQSARVWLALYLNITVIILVYVFIVIKLLILSVHENQQESRKRKTFSSHMAYDSPDYNIPLASIAERTKKTSTFSSTENPVADFIEMAREVSEEDNEDVIASFNDENDFMQPTTSAAGVNSPILYDEPPKFE